MWIRRVKKYNRKIHQLLIEAAKAIPGILPEPEPFVWETSLNDWYSVYQVNAYIRDADQLTVIYSVLSVHAR